MKNWHKIRLSDCCEIASGATPKTGIEEYWDGDIRWATPKDLSVLPGVFIHDTPRKITSAGLKSCAAVVLPANSVLLSSRAPIGHVAINTVPMATNQGFKSLIPDREAVEPKYLYWWLKANRSYLESLGNGATFKEISKAIVSQIEVPLPDLEEQRRIAEVLDRADELRTKRHEALAHLDSLTQFIFLDLFGDSHRADRAWQHAPLADLAKEFRYGTSMKSGPTGFPTLRIPNIVRGTVDLQDLKTVPVTASEFARLKLQEGDLLFVRTNGNPDFVGRCAVFKEAAVTGSGCLPNQFIYASYLIRVRVDTDLVHPTFVQSFMSGGEGRAALRDRCKTSAGQYNVNTQGLGSVRIPLPPLSLQQEFVRQLAFVEELQARHRASEAELNALFASLQDRAFRGLL